MEIGYGSTLALKIPGARSLWLHVSVDNWETLRDVLYDRSSLEAGRDLAARESSSKLGPRHGREIEEYCTVSVTSYMRTRNFH